MGLTNDCRSGCEAWVTGGLDLVIERDAAEGHVTAFVARNSFPARWAVSPKFVGKLTRQVPGAAEMRGGRLILRPGNREHAYRRTGRCESCGYILLEYEGATSEGVAS